MTKFMKLGIAYALIAVALVPVNTGAFYAEFDAIYSCQKWAVAGHKKRLGNSIALGIMYSVTWPVTTPMAFLTSGFWEQGIRFSPMTREERALIKPCAFESER